MLSYLEALNKYLQHTQLTVDAPMTERARQVAVQAHVNQTRWNDDAYVTHPIRVSAELLDDDEKIVGYLHDVVEDSDLTLEDLHDFGFTAKQIEAVDSVTRRDGENYLEFVLRSKKNPIGRKVKINDLKDNLRDLDHRNHNRKEKYEMAVWILELP